MAEEHRLMVMEKFGDEIMDEDKDVVVLVKAPWNSEKCGESAVSDAIYYRCLAHRTFFDYLSDDETELEYVSDYYIGDALVKDVVEQLNGILVIDMTTGENHDQWVCHSFKNPNSHVMTKEVKASLVGAVLTGDKIGLFEDFEAG